MSDAKKTMLCAIKFWAGAGMPDGARAGRTTLRKGARKVARTQGFTPTQLDTAERQLVAEGLITKPGIGTVALTSRGIARAAKSCGGVSLAPWDSASATHPRRR